MPVDTTRVISTRRTQKQISEEELKDIELKRLRGELSCAECRRLKLRCDKKVPCGSCLRRGCESICPCGILSAGQGTRFILADTDQLHRKIADMSNRIRQLEDALAILQAAVSDERHPLLSDDHLKVKFGSEALDPKKAGEATGEEDSKHAIDALGTLTLGESGEMKYFGRSAGSETLMMAEDGADEDDEGQGGEASIPLSPELEHLENMVPLLSHREPTLQLLQHFDSFLPSRDKAVALCEVYLQHGTFFFRPVKRDDLNDSLLPAVYQAALIRLEGGADAMDDNAPHATATLFFIFSLGALLDVHLLPYNGKAEHYYHLGKAALSLRPVCGSPSLETVQAVGLMATYHNLAGKKYSRDSAWCIMSLAAKLAQSFGLHRDSARWNLDAKTVQKRRNLFWEVFASDVSHSLALGRPPAIHLSYVDCEFPDDEEAGTNQAGEPQRGFWALKHHYAKHIFYAVAEATLTAQAPSYETVLDLDKKVREMSYQSASKPYASKEIDGKETYHSSSLSLRDFYTSQYRTVTMIYLHRSFFAQAVLDHPTNPLLSSFAPSFLTAYRCASVMIKASVHQFDRCASMAKRVWFLLYHTFSAAVIAGTVVTRSPNSSMARNALKDLNVAIGLFEQAADQSHRARIALTVLKRLHDKAQRSFKAVETGEVSTPDAQATSSADEGQDDELAIFGGQLRVVTKKSKTRETSAIDTLGSPQKGPTGPRNRAFSTSTIEGSETGHPSGSSPISATFRPPGPSGPTPGDRFGSTGLTSPKSTFFAPGSQHHSSPSGGLFPSNVCSTPSNYYDPTNTQFPGLNTSTPCSTSYPHHTTDWSTSWDFGIADGLVPGPNLMEPEWLTSGAPITTPIGPMDATSGASLFDNIGSQIFGGSDASMGQYPQASQYDLQENAGLLSSMFGQGSSAVGQPPFHPNHFGEVYTAGSEGDPRYRTPMGIPGAVELGLSGESRLDSGWIAFMRDCGIFGMDTSA